MRTFLRVTLWSVLTLAATGAVLFAYFIYTPAPEMPQLSGKITAGTIDSGGHVRRYLLYTPRDLPKGAPLVIAMHGSGESAERMRVATGYGFERLADQRAFAVVYPQGFEGYWNACNVVGDYAANKLNIDDVGFLTALTDKLVSGIGVDPARIFAMGISRGGHMAFRLALEAPARFRAVIAVAANVPAPTNFKCKAPSGGTPSVMIMNGTEDPLNPFNGGEVRLFGFIARGTVLSSHDSAQYFATLNGITAQPSSTATDVADGNRVVHELWRGQKAEIELVAIHGGGHVIPQPYFRYPRILGPTPREPDGLVLMWDFFARQQPR